MSRHDSSLPLAAARERLAKKPGRPRKNPPEVAGARALEAPGGSRGPSVAGGSGTGLPVPCPARLLDVAGAARYLAVSPWTIRDLIGNGTLRRIRVPLPNNGELRKVLLDRADLDRLIEAWKEAPCGG